MKIFKKRKNITAYGSLTRIATSMSRYGKMFYTLSLSTRSYKIEVVFSPLNNSESKSLKFRYYVNRVHLKVRPYIYRKSVTSIKYNKRRKKQAVAIRIIEKQNILKKQT